MSALPCSPELSINPHLLEGPRVYFDIDLPKQDIVNMDFDGLAFANHMKANNVTDFGVALTNVHFRSSQNEDHSLRIGARSGSYDPVSRTMDIPISKTSTEEKTNKVVLHEGEHRIQHCMGTLNYGETLTKIQTSGMHFERLGVTGLVSTCVLAIESIASPSSNTLASLFSMCALTLFSFATGTALESLTKDEREARKAEQLPLSFVSIERDTSRQEMRLEQLSAILP